MKPIAKLTRARRAALGTRIPTSPIRPRLRWWSWVMGAALVLVFGLTGHAQLLVDHVAFHDSIPSARFNLESGAVDNGGTMFVFLRNSGATAETITNLTVNGTGVTNLPGFKWWRVRPSAVPAGGLATLTVKANESPLSEGSSVSVVVQAASGATVSASAQLTTPPLRLGHVVPSQDLRTIYLFLRNTDTAACTITSVFLNDEVTAQSTFVGGPVIDANRVGIIKVAFPHAQPLLKDFAVRVTATRAGGGVWTVAAPVRLLEPWLPIGTWSSSMYDAEAKLQFARSNLFDVVVGTGNSSSINGPASRYFVRAISEATGTNDLADPNQVGGDVGNPNIHSWMLADEPDINNRSSASILARERSYQALDPSHTTYLNLAANRKFNEYGHIPDVVSMDHYAAHSAPNVIPSTWVLRKAALEEALDYVEILKRNTEPKRMWAWPQGIAGTWGTQPRDWAIALQYWMAIMGGAKGYTWFLCREGEESISPSGYEIMRRVTRQFAQVRQLVLYSEAIENVASSDAKVVARALVGEQAVVVPVLNLNYSIGGLAFAPSYSLSSRSGTLTVPVPSWLWPPHAVYEVTETGSVPASYTTAGNAVELNVSLGNTAGTCSKVFVIGRRDTNAPSAPGDLGIASIRTNNAVVLSWREPWDNFGVQGYRVYRNGVLLGNVPAPLFVTAPLAPQELAASQFAVRAVDSAGNLSPLTLTPQTLVSTGSRWKYHDSGANLGTAWRAPAYNDSGWSNGPAMLGFGDANGLLPATTVSNRGQYAFYFRRAFTVADPTVFTGLSMRLQRDDGAVVYLNGLELWRDNMPDGTILYNTPAASSVGGSDESAFWTRVTNAAALVPGTNVLAVEVHQINTTSSDVAFDFELTALTGAPPAPSLSVARDDAQLTFTWPMWAVDAALQTTTNLRPPVAWAPQAASATLSNGLWRAAIPAGTNSQVFYRLQLP